MVIDGIKEKLIDSGEPGKIEGSALESGKIEMDSQQDQWTRSR
jgi:hypothetical protein